MFIAWAADPLAYAQIWSLCVAEIQKTKAPANDPAACATIDDLSAVLTSITDRPPDAPPVPATQPSASGIWLDYADIADGRVHLRRAGAPDKRPLLMFQSAPGSSGPLSGLIEVLAPNHQVIAPDYLGNGDSAKPQRNVDIALLARDALQLADWSRPEDVRPLGHAHRRTDPRWKSP